MKKEKEIVFFVKKQQEQPDFDNVLTFEVSNQCEILVSINTMDH